MCKIVVSLRDGILILTTNKHELTQILRQELATKALRHKNQKENQTRIFFVNRGERRDCAG
jgi:hypothetical protein